MLFPSLAHAMGAAPGGAEGGPAGGLAGFLPLILMFGIFYFLLIRPQQKKAKAHKEMLAGLQKGDKIITSGGLYGQIVAVNGDEMTVELAENLQVKMNRNFVTSLENPPKAEKKKD